MARKPIVQYVVEELVSNGIEQILFVTGRSKASIENHFDHDPELFHALTQSNKQDLLKDIDFESAQGAFLLHPPAPPARLGRRHHVRGKLRRREAVSGGAGRFDPRAECRLAGGLAHGGSFRIEARQLRDRGGRSAARRDLALRHRAARAGSGRCVPHPEPGGKAGARRSAEQPGDRRPLHFLAGDLRHDPPRTAGQARRDPTHRRDPVHVRRRPARDGGETFARGEALRHRQLSKLLRELRRIRPRRSRCTARISGAPWSACWRSPSRFEQGHRRFSSVVRAADRGAAVPRPCAVGGGNAAPGRGGRDARRPDVVSRHLVR